MNTSTSTPLQRARQALEQAQQALDQARAALAALELASVPTPAPASMPVPMPTPMPAPMSAPMPWPVAAPARSEPAVPRGAGYTSSALSEDTPLSAVMSYLNFLQETEGLSDEAHAQVSKAVMDYLTFLQDEAEHLPSGSGPQASRLSSAHLLSLINDLLEYAKILQGAQSSEPVDVDLQWAVSQIHQLLAERAQARNLEYALVFANDLPVAVRLDLTSLTRVLVEVLGNAIKFTAHGRVLTQVSVLSALANADQTVVLCLAVTDSGPGVPAQDAQRIFEPFVQLAAGQAVGHDVDGHGHGLGLAMARSLARAHGGDLLLRHATGLGGATFEVHWPVTVVQGTSVLRSEAASATLEEVGRLELQASDGQGMTSPVAMAADDALPMMPLRVLVVDDHQLNRMVAISSLKRAFPQSTLEEAKNGTEALHKMSQQRYDLVLMDLVMPDYSGTEVVRRVRALPPPLCDVLVIAGTANVGEEAIAECAKVGIAHVMAKPVAADALVKTVRQLLG